LRSYRNYVTSSFQTNERFETFPQRNVLYRQRGWIRTDRASPVDPFQQHRQLRAAQRHGSLFRFRPDESAAFQSLGEQAQSVAIPPEQLDQIASPAAEDEDVTRMGILLQHRLCDRAQTRESPSQVGNAGRNPDA